MVELTVYGDSKATCTQRVLILLEELDLKYTLNQINLANEEQKTEEYLKLQPFGKVPVVSYGDRMLFESRAILRYISKNNRFDDVNLFGDVNADIWLEVESQNFNPPVSRIVAERMFKKGEKANDDIISKSLEELEKVLDVYDKQLEDRDYIAGDNYTIADISHIPYAYCFLKCGYKSVLKARPNVYAWLKRIMLRPAVKLVLEKM